MNSYLIIVLSSSIALVSAQFSFEPGSFDGIVTNGRGGLGHLEKHRQHHDVSYYNAYHENPFGVIGAPYHYGFATYPSQFHAVAMAAPVYTPYHPIQTYSPYQFASPYHPYQVLSTPYQFGTAAHVAPAAPTAAATTSSAAAAPSTVDTVHQQGVQFHPSMFNSAFGFNPHSVSGH